MSLSTTRALSLLCLLLPAVLFSTGAHAHDLVLQDVKVIKVSPCDRQIRLTVRLDSVGHKHLAGKDGAGPYKIDVLSVKRKKNVVTFKVSEHDPGETLYFVIPSSKLACDSRVRLVVDSGNAVDEVNEKNNAAVQQLLRPKSSGLYEACPVDPDQCK